MSSNTASKIGEKKDTFAKAGKVLSLALKRYGIDKQVARYQFVLHWNEIVGEQIAKRSYPEAIVNGVLVLRVSNSEWAQELAFHKDILVKRLNGYLKKNGEVASEVVKDIRFVVGQVRNQSA